MKFKTIVTNWRYSDGYHRYYLLGKMIEEFSEAAVGWECWVYPEDNLDLNKWMEENMIGDFECDFRFNSGDPMYTVFIKSDQDATAFKLKWM